MSATNAILAGLSRADFLLLEPYLEHIDLPVRRKLELRNRRVSHVYFLTSGFASIVAHGSSGPSIEVGIIGREGMTGLSVVLSDDDHLVQNEAYIQSAGAGWRMPAAKLREAIDVCLPMRRLMLRYAHSFLMQATQTALANGRSKIEERLARWLLMADDRIGGEMALTQEFLSLMLGVRRPGVTMAMQELERRALITRKRGHIAISDREGLLEISNGTYQAPFSL